MLRKKADLLIGGMSAGLLFPIVGIFRYDPEISDIMAYFAAVLAIIAALCMGRPAFPEKIPEGPDSESLRSAIADQQNNFWIGTGLLMLAGAALLPTLIKNLDVQRWSICAMEIAATLWFIRTGIMEFKRDNKHPLLRPLLWGSTILGSFILTGFLLLSGPNKANHQSPDLTAKPLPTQTLPASATSVQKEQPTSRPH
ncbi:membrane protein of unknown function [Burkholderia multivorans]